MKDMAFKLRSGNVPLKFKEMGSTPAKHSTNRSGHNDSYDTFDDDGKRTKKHTNAAHPRYWKVQEGTTETTDKNPDYDETKKRYITAGGTFTNFSGDDRRENPDYDETKSDERKNYKYTKYYASNKDKEIQRTRHKKKGGGYIGDMVYKEQSDVGHTSTNTKDRVGKTDRNTYGTGSKSKSKSSSSSKSNKSSKKRVSYEASYTSAVAEKWKDKGGKEAYIKAAKAWNAKNRK